MTLLGLVASLIVDASYSWARLLIALAISIVLGLLLGIYAAISSKAERVLIPVLDVFQTLPILAFFPFVIYVIVATIPSSIGIDAAVIFLIITSMLWNIAFGAYEAVKALPNEVFEVARLYGMDFLERMRRIYLPASMPKVIDQSMLSWSIGLFYLVTSEIFSTGSAIYQVKHGIGVALTALALSGNYVQYLIGIAVFVVFVVLTRFLLFVPLRRHFNKFNEEHVIKARRANVHRTEREMHAIETLVRRRAPTMDVRPRHMLARSANNTIVHIETAEQKLEKERMKSALIAFAISIAAMVVTAAVLLPAMITKGFIHDEYVVLTALLASFTRVWLVFALVLAVAIPTSIYLLFMSKRIEQYLLTFQILASIPATILLPVIVAVLVHEPMHDELVAFSILFLSGIWYVLFGIFADRSYIHRWVFEVRDLFHVKGVNAWKNIYVKAVLPGLITGGITAVAAEWNACIVAEYFTSSAVSAGTVITAVHTGIGVLLDTSLQAGNLPLMLLALINLTIMILIINKFVWRKLYDRMAKSYK
jgi:NitT/TauT family transport system permease protein